MLIPVFAVSSWPNWIDLIILTLVLKGCYNGFAHGLLTELLNLLGAVTITALTINYAGVLTSWLQSWVALPTYLTALLGFWVLFFGLLIVVHGLVRQITRVMKWEWVNWIVQGVGLFLGGIRGLWWAGFLLVVLSASGFAFFQEGVEKNSVLGPRFLDVAHASLEEVTARFPGTHKHATLVPPWKPASQ